MSNKDYINLFQMKKKLYKYKLPKIIKETLGKDIYDKMSNVISEPTSERECVIYGSPKCIDIIEEAITEEFKNRIK